MKVTGCDKESVKKFPCLLKGVTTKNYYMAYNKNNGVNLTLQCSHIDADFTDEGYEEVDCVTISMED